MNKFSFLVVVFALSVGLFWGNAQVTEAQTCNISQVVRDIKADAVARPAPVGGAAQAAISMAESNSCLRGLPGNQWESYAIIMAYELGSSPWGQVRSFLAGRSWWNPTSNTANTALSAMFPNNHSAVQNVINAVFFSGGSGGSGGGSQPPVQAPAAPPASSGGGNNGGFTVLPPATGGTAPVATPQRPSRPAFCEGPIDPQATILIRMCNGGIQVQQPQPASQPQGNLGSLMNRQVCDYDEGGNLIRTPFAKGCPARR